MAGYSSKPLVRKLGIKEGYRVCVVGAPPSLGDILGTLPDGVMLAEPSAAQLDVVLWFATSRAELEHHVTGMLSRIAVNGMIWICWPKRASKLQTDLNENAIRELGLATGWVDIKVCAVDEQWSGLKFVRRLADRGKAA